MPPSILVWHEDAAPGPLLGILRCVFANTVALETPPTHFAARIRAGNAWRSRKQPHLQVDLRRYLADQLAMENRFVLFHYDADTPWGRGERCATREQFDELIRIPIGYLLAGRKTTVELVERLHEVVPHYSLEAWLYQATSTAKALCLAKHQGKHQALWGAYEASRSSLDDVVKPKDNDCIQDRHNADLAPHFPLEDALAIGKSFLAMVQGLAASAALRPHLSPRVLAAVNASPTSTSLNFTPKPR